MAIPLKYGDVPRELQCHLCFSIPLDPRILKPCSHVFCKDCIHRRLSYRQYCPACRSDCLPEQVLLLKEESSIAHRIWSNIPIKCKQHRRNGCTWTGAISDYKAHEKSCPATEILGAEKLKRDEASEIHKELECPICFSIPHDPRILKTCSHVFCKDCIHESLSHRHFCPVCRSDCVPEHVLLLKEESSIAHRIWSNIPIKCKEYGKGCTWTGAISDYKAHEESCLATVLLKTLRLVSERRRVYRLSEESSSSESEGSY